jgi:PTH1 family peptidyl-tRNA hydrolase
MYLLVGLGNPGPSYSLNRHNIGFITIDSLAHYYNFPPFRAAREALFSEGEIEGTPVILCKPQTYMNLSGQAVHAWVQFFKMDLSKLIVMHDDLDLRIWDVRVKKGGSDGGHKGLLHISKTAGREYWRIRIGIGRPITREDVTRHVLADFTRFEQSSLPDLMLSFCQALPFFLKSPYPDWANDHVLPALKTGTRRFE